MEAEGSIHNAANKTDYREDHKHEIEPYQEQTSSRSRSGAPSTPASDEPGPTQDGRGGWQGRRNNSTRFEQSCREIADRVKIPGRRDRNANIFELLKDWLHDKKKGEWLLILDNLDDDTFLQQPPPARQSRPEDASRGISERTIWEYFPQSLPGSILVTSRSTDAISSIVEDEDIVIVEPMGETHAAALFSKKLAGKLQFHAREASQLVTALDFMPLAIIQAATYIKQRAPRVSVPRYLEYLQESDDNKIILLSHKGGHLRRDREARNAIFLTWQITFDHLRQVRRTAADLLALMSFFDRQGIPDIVLRDQPGSNDADPLNAPGSSHNRHGKFALIDTFEEDVVALRNYSLISISTEGMTFEMHRLVQLAIQDWLKAQQQLDVWKASFVRRLSAHFPSEMSETEARCQLLFSHVKHAFVQMPEDVIPEWAILLENAGQYASEIGDVRSGIQMTQTAIESLKRLFGPDDMRTIHCIASLASVYFNAGQFDEAEKWQTHVIHALEKELGPADLHVFAVKSDLALTYYLQCRLLDSERLAMQAKNHFERGLGIDNPGYIFATDILGAIYRHQGRLIEAEMLGIEEIEISKRILGPDHTSTLVRMRNLSRTYFKQGRLKEAEDLQLQTVKAVKRKLGMEHPFTLTCLGTLASIYHGQGRLEEAEQMRLEILEICERTPRIFFKEGICK
ncbi:Kinesin light chain 1 [Penicillium subrubescens]|uniref:Kinesin light chain 1 n=1 Tax=Penicillium subrubescens TaxID=1316194 RepID=A0A1Q5URK6_9EURO|nr:Kinesin light chain 1 [Penicillium subrubescens]